MGTDDRRGPEMTLLLIGALYLIFALAVFGDIIGSEMAKAESWEEG